MFSWNWCSILFDQVKKFFKRFFKVKQGNFAAVFGNRFNNWDCRQVAICYEVFESIGPEAWNWVKYYPYFDRQTEESLIFKKIVDHLYARGVKGIDSVSNGVLHMFVISSLGWDNYVDMVQGFKGINNVSNGVYPDFVMRNLGWKH
jgi:hypothetical protein